MRRATMCAAMCLTLAATVLLAQAPRTIPRPPADAPGPPLPEAGSAAPDGYAPLPQWPGQTRAPVPPKTVSYALETVAQGISGPFSFNPLPNGRWIVAERGGHIRLVGKNGALSEVEGLPSTMWARAGQGLFEVRPDKDFAANRTVYLGYTVMLEGANLAALPRTPGVLTVARARLSADDRRLEDVKVLLNAEGTTGRVIQAPDGTLLISSAVPGGLGVSSTDWPQPQQLDSDMGKMLRINPDGSVPKDNPFSGRAGARPEIYAIGVRDVQGVAIQPGTGRLWASEHGPRGGDEINVIKKGRNYGFPVIGYGREYTGRPINGDKTAQDGMEQPVYFWTPDVAPAGIAFYSGKLFPAWQGDLFVAELAGKCLSRLVLKGDRVVAEERLLTEVNSRIRGVNEGADGALYVLTDGNPVPPGPSWDRQGKILKLTPADSQVNSGPPPGTTEESRRALEAFSQLLYVDRNVTAAMGRYFDAHLIQHDAEIGDGGHGDDAFLKRRQTLHPEQYLSPEQFHTVVDNLMADGDLVVAKSHVYTNPTDRGRVFVDIWRVAGGKFVEHWDVIQPVPATSLNQATMWCGGASNWEDAGKAGDMVARPGCGRSGPAVNRDRALATVNAYVAMLEEQGRAADAVQAFVADDFVQHSPQIAPGKKAFAKYLTDRTAARKREGRKSETARTVADGDLVLMHRRVTTKADPRGQAHADLYRVRDGKIVEHWDVMQLIPSFSLAGHSMVDGPLEPGRTKGRPPDPR